MLVIDPDECIDCGGCIPECPVNAIYPEDDLPEDQKQLIEINAALASKWPTITDTKDPLIEADAFKDVKGKLKNLQRSGWAVGGE